MNRLAGKVVIVTGASLGIGRAISILAAEEGARVAVTDVLETPGKELVENLRAQKHTAHFWHLDVSSEKAVRTIVREIEHTYGRIDVLINNAGIAGANKPTDEITEAEWDHLMAVNVKGVFFCTKHVIPALRRSGGGSIVNLSSIYGIVSAPDLPPYHASKGAVRLMTKTDALLFAKDNIRANSIHPGFIWTPLVEKFLADQGGDLSAAKARIASLHPLNRMGDPMDIAYGAVYLASDESRFVTGGELVIDGGYTCR